MGGDLLRRRLLTTVEQTPGLWLVEGCAGSGKSRLARQLARQHECPVAAQVPVGKLGQSIVVDVGDSCWEPSANEASLLLELPDDTLTVIMARRIGTSGVDLGSQLGARWLRTADLWFDDDELAEFGAANLGEGRARRIVKALRSLTDGWPAAVDACVDEAGRCQTAQGDFGATARTAFGSVLEPVLASLDVELSEQLNALSFFERFDSELAAVLGFPHLLDELVDAGVPLINDGRWSFLGSVARATIRSRVCGVPSIGGEVLDHLVARGRLIEAIEAATELGRDETAARLLAGLGADDAYALDAARSGAVAARLGAALADTPRVHLVRARQRLSTGDITSTIAELRDGLTSASAQVTLSSQTSNATVAHGESEAQPPVIEELKAELAYALYLSGDLDGARSHLPDHDFEFAPARARQYQVIAGLDALTMERSALDRAAQGYRMAEQLWSESGEVITAGSVLTSLAMEVTSRLGKTNEAIALVERSLPTAAANPLRQSATQLIRVRLLVLAGRHDEAKDQLRDVEGLVGIVLRGWMAAHVHQARAILSSHQGDHPEVVHQISLAQRELGDLSAHAPGATLHCDAVDVFVRTGDVERARVHLEALRSHPGAEPPDLRWAETTFECRMGDARRGRVLAEAFRSSGVAVPGGEWKLDFAESVAAERLGQPEESKRLAAAAEQSAASVGTPRIIEDTEQARAAAPPSPPAVRHTSIKVLGEFEVLVQGASVHLPRGHGRTLLKLLTLRSGQMTVDEMIDALWPDGDPAVRRRRLRNVLSRLRTACGEIVDRDGDLLRLSDPVMTDFGDWWHDSMLALTKDEANLAELRGLAASAPDVLLPSDRYEEWLQPLQHRYQLQLLRLLDTIVLVGSATSTEVALDAQRRGLEIDPWSTERIERAINLLQQADRFSEAQALELQLADLG